MTSMSRQPLTGPTKADELFCKEMSKTATELDMPQQPQEELAPHVDQLPDDDKLATELDTPQQPQEHLPRHVDTLPDDDKRLKASLIEFLEDQTRPPQTSKYHEFSVMCMTKELRDPRLSFTEPELQHIETLVQAGRIGLPYKLHCYQQLQDGLVSKAASQINHIATLKTTAHVVALKTLIEKLQTSTELDTPQQPQEHLPRHVDTLPDDDKLLKALLIENLTTELNCIASHLGIRTLIADIVPAPPENAALSSNAAEYDKVMYGTTSVVVQRSSVTQASLILF
eukprot:GHVQ01035825.1.p2 GENE.GHVQ01035825.1~~GHVQ01035825.1.p2  ORF type:complete len:284 (+),score=45.45 GHVQ01035825.1:378-1229(+)